MWLVVGRELRGRSRLTVVRPTALATQWGARVCAVGQLQPLVEPQVSHLRQVPLRTSVKFMHSEQASPS